MTPKERAKELVSKCYNSLLLWSEQDNAKQCALIAVEEILKEIKDIDDGSIFIPYKYWQEVKQEIELL